MLQHAFHGLWSPDMVAARADLTNDLLASAQAAEDRALEVLGEPPAPARACETGDFGRARALSNSLEELAAALQQPTLSWVAQMEAAALTVVEGNLVAGEERARKALAIGELAGQPDALRIFGEFRALARLYQGRGDAQLIELSRQATSMFPRMAIWPASTAQYEAHFGNQEAARKLLGDAVESGLGQIGWDTLRLVALSFYADAASRLHAADAAALIHELMSPWDDQVIWGGAQAYGHVRLWLGVAAATMGRADEADEAFDFACRFHDDRPEVVVGQVAPRLGGGAGRSWRACAAQTHAARALELAQAHGYGLIEALAAPIAASRQLQDE